MIKIVSGFTEKGGSTTCLINLTNLLNENGIECTFYGNQDYHRDRCRSGNIARDLEYGPDDVVITHFLELPERPPVRRVILSSHEKWWFPVGRIKQYWDVCVFLHEEHRQYHSDYRGGSVIIPNPKENLVSNKKGPVKNVAGIIGTIEERKQTHVSIQRALRDQCEPIYLFGHIGEPDYFEQCVKPLLNPGVIHLGHTENKQKMYDQVGRVYHSSIGEVACLVKDECHLTGTEFYGNEETMHEVSKLTNGEILALWKNIF
ncbi:MAG: hypothetical protein SFY92_12650 [Verrucomicrobiae bacterium]|nr:hypothetical protein [Verrucomicrobiae bacterium]